MDTKAIKTEGPVGRVASVPSFELVFQRLEKEILEGRKLELCSQVIKRRISGKTWSLNGSSSGPGWHRWQEKRKRL